MRKGLRSGSFCAAILMLCAGGLLAQQVPYREVWYQSGTLRIQAYLYTPPGTGPFPVVIYNHGSRPPGNERLYGPMTAVAKVLVADGYMVFEPTRRGYGRSDGQPTGEEIGTTRGDAYIRRLWEEAGDILAAEKFLATIRSADRQRVGMIGYSEGGTLSIFAASEAPGKFACIVDQAGGTSWDRSPQLRQALPAAAAKVHVPLLAMIAANDRTTASVRAVVEAAQKAHDAARLIIYPPYTPPAEERPPGGGALGHAIFRDHGIPIWQGDVLAFLDGCLRHPASSR